MIKSTLPYLLLGVTPTEYRLVPDVNGELYFRFSSITVEDSHGRTNVIALTPQQTVNMVRWHAQLHKYSNTLRKIFIRERYLLCVKSDAGVSITSIGRQPAAKIIAHLNQTQTFIVWRQQVRGMGNYFSYNAEPRPTFETVLPLTIALADQVNYVDDEFLAQRLKAYVGSDVWEAVPFYQNAVRQEPILSLDF